MGGGVNKLLLPLRDRPLLAVTLDYFQSQVLVDGVVLSAAEDQIPVYQALVRDHSLSKVHKIVAGGAERQDSIFNALEALPAGPGDAVAIHDGARPRLAPDLLQRLMLALDSADGSLPMVAVKDTVKRVDAQGRVLETLIRSELYAAQTPQVFRYSVILDAHRRAKAEGFLGTDDCSLVERYGGSIQRVEGDYSNVKVTTPEDLSILAAHHG